LRTDTNYQILIKKPILSDTLTDTDTIGGSLVWDVSNAVLFFIGTFHVTAR